MNRLVSKRRSGALRQARELARSGRFRDHSGVTHALADAGLIDEARSWFEDTRFLAQLDALCALASGRASRATR